MKPSNSVTSSLVRNSLFNPDNTTKAIAYNYYLEVRSGEEEKPIKERDLVKKELIYTSLGDTEPEDSAKHDKEATRIYQQRI